MGPRDLATCSGNVQLVQTLRAFGVRFLVVTSPPDAVDQLLAKKDGFPLKGPKSPFCADILRARDFANEWVSASQASIGGVPVRVVSARAMLESLACDTDQKHVQDVARLRRVLAARA